MVKSQPQGWALALIAAVTLWRVLVLALAAPNLSFDEAQYWAWAQHFALGYYSKPPLVAWVIAATTALFGESEGMVKLGAALAHGLTAGVLIRLGDRLFSPTVGAWAGIGWITLPAVSLSSVMITTDPFLLLFWAIGLLALVEATRTGPAPNRWWAVLGLAFGLGMLAKYAMTFFLAGLALWLVIDRGARPALKGRGPAMALALGLLVYCPNLIWNAANGFVSYAHTRDNANLGGSLFHPDKLAEFVGGQFGVAGPLLLAGLAAALVAALRRGDAAQRLLAAFTIPVLAVMGVEALLSRANANWTAPAYVAGVVLASAWMAERWPRVLVASLVLHLAAMGVLYNLDPIRHLAGLSDDSRLDPMKRVRGWDVVGERLSAILAGHPGARLLGDERKVLAPLIYYVSPHPFDAVKWNPDGAIHDYFDQTTTLVPGPGRYIYITDQPEGPTLLAPHFAAARPLGTIADHVSAGHGRPLSVWLLEDFRGYGR